MVSKTKQTSFIIAVMFLASINCDRSKEEDIVARVGKVTLTLKALKENIPEEYSNQITRDQNINYVKQWIDRELLYQEAISQKIDKESEIKERLEKMKEDLLSAEMLHRISSAIKIEDVNDSIANQYYNKNRDQFIRDKEYVRYLDITTDDSKKAWDIYRSANKDNFVTLASQYSKTPTFDSTNIPYTATETIPAEIRQAINLLRINSISTPIKAADGYHIINLLEKLNEGEICNFQEVRKDIINQIITNNQKEIIEKKLADLRIKNRVDFNLNLISDSIKN